MKKLVWGCTQMLLGMLLVMHGALLFWLANALNMGMDLSMVLVVVGLALPVCGIVTMLAGYCRHVRPVLRDENDNK